MRGGAVVSCAYKCVDINHKKPVFMKIASAPSFNIYLNYWDERDGEAMRGWWFGDRVGSDSVWARHCGDTPLPPASHWQNFDSRALSSIAEGDLQVCVQMPLQAMLDHLRRVGGACDFAIFGRAFPGSKRVLLEPLGLFEFDHGNNPRDGFCVISLKN